jgi:SpoVK/Ycf46/Vps4 family AAA+-type ATPase
MSTNPPNKDTKNNKRSRDSSGSRNISSSKSRRHGKNFFTRSYKFGNGGGGGGGNDNDDDFIDILLGTFYNEKRKAGNNYEDETDEEYEEVFIKKEIENVDDLIELGEMYNPKEKKRYNIDVKTLNKLIEPLTMLKKMIGMPKLKKSIVDQIIYFLQDFEEKNAHMMHTVIEGPPGSGKTDIANILAKIYARIGFLKKEYVKKVKRSDLIGQYLGQTAIKTQKAIDDAKGGVLLIDEAYSLGNPEGRDSYSKECIDTLNQNLSENKADIICIIVGYKKDLKESFFSYNAGLERRFPFRYTIDEYDFKDLNNIFAKLVNEYKWEIKVDEKKLLTFFEDNRDTFAFNGGDLETLLQCSKIAHSKRVFCLPKAEKKKLTNDDIESGFKIMCQNDEVKKIVLISYLIYILRLRICEFL